MNWLTVLGGLYKLIPYVVAGVEVIHTNESSETKTQLALDALNIATQASTHVLGTSNSAIASVVSTAVSTGIQSVQDIISTIKNTTTQSATVTSAPPSIQPVAAK
jgi:hypothetical protein